MTNSDLFSYYNKITSNIPGWLLPHAAELTVALLERQEATNIRGPMFEIGVYGGKYLSLLYCAAKRTGCQVVGIDPYDHFSFEQVAEHLGAKAGDSTLRFHKALSTDLDAHQLRDLLGGRARFVSLDGSHDASDVAWDLRLAYDVLGPRGIISVDDFLNTECLGVVEAVGRFLDAKPNLAPFLYTQNKLFLAPLRAADFYRETILDFARQHPENDLHRILIERFDQNPRWVMTEFYGHWFLVT